MSAPVEGSVRGRGFAGGGVVSWRRVLVLFVCGLVPLAAASWAVGDETVSGQEKGSAVAEAYAYDQAEENASSGLESARAQVAARPDPKLYDGRGSDSPWSASRGGRTLDGGGMVAEVGISYVGEGADGADEYEVRAVGRHGAARRAASGMVRHPGVEGGSR